MRRLLTLCVLAALVAAVAWLRPWTYLLDVGPAVTSTADGAATRAGTPTDTSAPASRTALGEAMATRPATSNARAVTGRVVVLPEGRAPGAAARVRALPFRPWEAAAIPDVTAAAEGMLRGITCEDEPVSVMRDILRRRGLTEDDLPATDCAPDGTFRLEEVKFSPFYLQCVGDCLLSPEGVEGSFPDHARDLRLPVVKTGRLSGTVRDADGQPVAGAWVYLTAGRAGLSFLLGRGGGPVIELIQRTDREGRFAFRAVRPGLTHRLLVFAQGHATGTEDGIQVAVGERRELDLRLGPGCRVAGTVLDPAGAPIPGAVLEARRVKRLSLLTSPTPEPALPCEARSDAQGRFTLAGLCDGPLRLAAAAPGFARFELPLDLTPGEARADLELRLAPEGVLEGTVVDADDQPVRGAELLAAEPDQGMEQTLAGGLFAFDDMGVDAGSIAPLGRARSDAEGRFRIPQLPVRRVTLSARAPGFLLLRVRNLKPGGAPVALRLLPAARIRARVLDAQQEPVPSGQVTLVQRVLGIPVGLRRLSWNHPRGEVELRDLPAATLSLVFAAPGFAWHQTEELRLKSGEEQDLGEVELQRHALVSGLVVDRVGAPVPEADVRVEHGGRIAGMAPAFFLAAPTARTDARGAFELGGLPSGTVRLLADKDGLARGQSPELRVRAGERITDVRLVLEPGGSIAGVYRRKDGSGEAEGILQVKSFELGAQLHGLTDANGRFRIDGLTPGAWQVVAAPLQSLLPPRADQLGPGPLRRMMEAMQTRNVTVRAGETTWVEIAPAAEGGATLLGRVRSGEAPVPDAFVFVTVPGGGDSSLRMSMTDEDGRFALGGLPAGEQLVTIGRTQQGRTGAQASFRVALQSGQRVEREFELPACTVSGRVVSATTGQGIAGVVVSLRRTDGEAADPLAERFARVTGLSQSLSGAAGEFRFRDLAPGRYELTAGGPSLFAEEQAGRGRATIRDLPVTAEEPCDDVELRLPEGGVITGTVSGPDGEPVAGAAIFLARPGGEALGSVSPVASGARGEFRYSGVPAGSWQIVARARGLAPGRSAAVAPGPDATAVADVALGQGSEVTVTVLDPDGQEAPKATVRVFDAQGTEVSGLWAVSEVFEQLASAGGARRFRLAPGPHRLVVQAPGCPEHKEEFVMPVGSVTVRLRR